jgi:hypothetical protein
MRYRPDSSALDRSPVVVDAAATVADVAGALVLSSRIDFLTRRGDIVRCSMGRALCAVTLALSLAVLTFFRFLWHNSNPSCKYRW